MKFSLNVAPLKDALNLGVINSNISKFFEKSTVVELTVDGDTLRINTQATSLLSEALIKGSNDDNGSASAIVDCTLFKQLVSTVDVNEMTLDFEDNFLVVECGKSKFNVPKLLTDEDGASLDRPASESEIDGNLCGELHPSTWKYVQDHQLYAVAMSQINKVYTRVWIGGDKGVLTGDPTLSFFTYQPSSDLDSSCLVSSTIVNLLSTLDEGSKMYKVSDNSYVVVMDSDTFTFKSQFMVDHEDEGGMGTYDADMIFEMVFDETQVPVEVSKPKLYSNVKQAELFSSSSNPLVYVEADNSGLKLVNDNVNCKISSDSSPLDYKVGFTLNDLDTVVSHMDGDTIEFAPIVKEGEVFGVRLKSGDLVALLGGVE